MVAAARAHRLTLAEIEQWKERFLTGAAKARPSKPLDEAALQEQEIKRLKQKGGELVMELDSFKEATKGPASWRQMADAAAGRAVLPRFATSAASSRGRAPRSSRRQFARRCRLRPVPPARTTSLPLEFMHCFSRIRRAASLEAGRCCGLVTTSSATGNEATA